MNTYNPDLALECIQDNPYKDTVAELPVDFRLDLPEIEALRSLRGEQAKQAQLACLYYDRVDVLRVMPFGFDWAMQWMLDNFEYTLQHTPNLFHSLAGNVFLYPQIVANTGRFVDKLNLGDEDRLSILRGQANCHVPSLGPWMQTCLGADPSLYLWLSPGWIGAQDSVLRKEARSLGWNEGMLAAMCRMHCGEKTKAPWVADVAFPYSMHLLDMHSTGPQEKEISTNGWSDESQPWFIKVNKHANPCDVAMATALLQHIDWPRTIELAMPPSARQAYQAMPTEEKTALQSVVQVHAGLGMLDALTSLLAKQQPGDGMVARLKEDVAMGRGEVLALPTLDGGPA